MEYRYFFIGIGGIGMSAIARYLHRQGVAVAGYDKTPSPLTQEWESDGISIIYEDQPSVIPAGFEVGTENLRVVMTPAIPADNVLLQHFQQAGVPIIKRSAMLAELAVGKKCLAVAGTHGKTTTSSILAHLCAQLEHGANAFVGGLMPAYESNVIVAPESDFIIVEADEFDRSFHRLDPYMAIITSVDPDHLDIYDDEAEFRKAFEEFAQRVLPEGRLYHHVDISGLETSASQYSYGIDSGDIQARALRVSDGAYHFDMSYGDMLIEGLSLSLPGRHNVLNALAASAIAIDLGLSPVQLKSGLQSYQGVKRRFEQVIRQDNLVYIDDYAHHPTEISACIASVRELYPGRKLTVAFQPHLYSRTRDFLQGFADSLSEADEVVLLPIYPARELPIPGVNIQALDALITVTNSSVCEKEELPTYIEAAELEVLLTLGAGDIDRLVNTLKNRLKAKYINTNNAKS